jgi:hypothetical protein
LADAPDERIAMGFESQQSCVGELVAGASAYIKRFPPPDGAFDPLGDWKQTFVLWTVNYKAKVGALVLERQKRDAQKFALKVEWHVQQRGYGFHHVSASISCASDALATPLWWRSEVKLPPASEQPLRGDRGVCEASARDGVIVTADAKKPFGDKPLGAWTSNWSLLEAVQRLDGEKAKLQAFTMLDFLDVRKDEQQLSFMGRQKVTCAGKELDLTGYQQVGRGILPYEYWVDENRRLRFVISGSRAYFAVSEDAK